MKAYKYPRTPHLPWSYGGTDDDKRLDSVDHFVGKEVVVTEKMDGECTTMTRDRCYARSIDSGHHESRAWVKQLHGRMGWMIPDGWRICGENMYAVHSIAYSNLPSYFLAYSVWDDQNYCLDWDKTVKIAVELGLVTVPVLRRGVWDERQVRLSDEFLKTIGIEGIVVRLAEGFHYDEFGKSVAKLVRADHVQTDAHWMQKPVVRNGLMQSA